MAASQLLYYRTKRALLADDHSQVFVSSRHSPSDDEIAGLASVLKLVALRDAEGNEAAAQPEAGDAEDGAEDISQHALAGDLHLSHA